MWFIITQLGHISDSYSGAPHFYDVLWFACAFCQIRFCDPSLHFKTHCMGVTDVAALTGDPLQLVMRALIAAATPPRC